MIHTFHVHSFGCPGAMSPVRVASTDQAATRCAILIARDTLDAQKTKSSATANANLAGR